MTTRTITITADDLAALKAIRSVVADAAGHPARDAAIAAIDRLGEATGCEECARRQAADERFMKHVAEMTAPSAEMEPTALGDLVGSCAIPCLYCGGNHTETWHHEHADRIPGDYDLRLLTECGLTEGGLPIHVHGSTAETWKRCQCGAKEADMVDGRIVVRNAPH